MSVTFRRNSVESLTTAITGLVADVESCDALDLPTLHNTIDVDALQMFCTDTLCSNAETTQRRTLSFIYSESLVHIEIDDDEITIKASLATEELVSETFAGDHKPQESVSQLDL
ncbi:HalOD1 output domain-containing protein [Salinigranum halophilum]|uniref:HalOD1 output domain-containing protein n=1 Tax=Salinigranum halophilum TaxID=2565931 RepID=UPI0013758CE9